VCLSAAWKAAGKTLIESQDKKLEITFRFNCCHVNDINISQEIMLIQNYYVAILPHEDQIQYLNVFRMDQ